MRAGLLSLITLALGLSGCAKKLEDFDTFACAKDDTCPSGYTCVANACRLVTPGGECTLEISTYMLGGITDPCTALGSSYHCVGGRCTAVAEGSACDSSSTDVCKQVNPVLTCVHGYERCLRKGCTSSGNCAAGTVCVNDLCLPSCTGGSGCGVGEHCAVTANGAACFPSNQGPGASCADGTGCPSFSPSLVCANGTCALSCGGASSCPGGQRCAGGACLDDCTLGQACGAGLECVTLGRADGAKVCARPGTGAGAACSTATGCAQGLHCNAGLCGSPCAGDSDCAAGSVCSGTIGASICIESCASAACPSGTACQDYPGGKRLCLPPGQGVGGSCGTSCPAAELTCLFGACRLPCANGTGCSAGQVCSVGSGAGACLTDCTASGVCPSGASCQAVRYSAKSACVTNGSSLPACKSVAKTSDCMLCGSQYEIPAASAVACSDSRGTWHCPVHTSCGATNNSCSCASGYQSKNCSGALCSSPDAGCNWPSWSCVPTTPPTPGCTTFPANYAGTCRCVDGRQLSFECGTSESCEKLCADGCNVAAQDCPAGKKCTLVVGDGGLELGSSETECTPEGAATLGQSCTRTSPGVDTCAKGTYCTRVAPAGSMVCRKLCRRDADCAGGEACINDDYFSAYPTYGLCLPRCSVSAAPSAFGSCPSGMGCSFLWDVDNVSAVAACRQLGTGAVTQPCSFDGECGAELECTSGACRAECSPSKSCAVGTCHPFSGTTGSAVGAGFCQ